MSKTEKNTFFKLLPVGSFSSAATIQVRWLPHAHQDNQIGEVDCRQESKDEGGHQQGSKSCLNF